MSVLCPDPPSSTPQGLGCSLQAYIGSGLFSTWQGAGQRINHTTASVSPLSTSGRQGSPELLLSPRDTMWVGENWAAFPGLEPFLGEAGTFLWT